MTSEEAIKLLELKFKSGNGIPVTRAAITLEEYEAIRQAILLVHRLITEEREACAKFMDMRADSIEREGFGVTSQTIARVYRDEANGIRNRETP